MLVLHRDLALDLDRPAVAPVQLERLVPQALLLAGEGVVDERRPSLVHQVLGPLAQPDALQQLGGARSANVTVRAEGQTYQIAERLHREAIV